MAKTHHAFAARAALRDVQRGLDLRLVPDGFYLGVGPDLREMVYGFHDAGWRRPEVAEELAVTEMTLDRVRLGGAIQLPGGLAIISFWGRIQRGTARAPEHPERRKPLHPREVLLPGQGPMRYAGLLSGSWDD